MPVSKSGQFGIVCKKSHQNPPSSRRNSDANIQTYIQTYKRNEKVPPEKISMDPLLAINGSVGINIGRYPGPMPLSPFLGVPLKSRCFLTAVPIASFEHG